MDDSIFILGERKFRLMNQRDMEKLSEDYHIEKYLRHQQIHETLDLLALFEKPDAAKLVREVAVALMGGRYVNIPCAGGGSVSSETGWDGRNKDEENEDFRLCCNLSVLQVFSLIFLTKNYKYCRLSLRSCDGLLIFLYLCSQNLAYQIEDYV